MKFAAAALVLAATAIAAPSTTSKRDPETCSFGTYRCTTPNTGIEICNVENQWELVGPCPDGQACEDLSQGDFTLPFCTVPAVEKRNGRPGQSPGEPCTVPGKFDCFGPYAIQVCNTTNVLELVGNCPDRSHCEYVNEIPFCVASV